VGRSIHFTGTHLYVGMPYGPSRGAVHALPWANVSGGVKTAVTTYQPGSGGLRGGVGHACGGGRSCSGRQPHGGKRRGGDRAATGAARGSDSQRRALMHLRRTRSHIRGPRAGGRATCPRCGRGPHQHHSCSGESGPDRDNLRMSLLLWKTRPDRPPGIGIAPPVRHPRHKPGQRHAHLSAIELGKWVKPQVTSTMPPGGAGDRIDANSPTPPGPWRPPSSGRRARHAACRCAARQYRRPPAADPGSGAPHQPHRTSLICGQCARAAVTAPASGDRRIFRPPSRPCPPPPAPALCVSGAVRSRAPRRRARGGSSCPDRTGHYSSLSLLEEQGVGVHQRQLEQV
jgi:hypothetical protein